MKACKRPQMRLVDGWLVGCCLRTLLAQGYIMPWTFQICYLGPETNI